VTVTIFHRGDAPRLFAELTAAGVPVVDYNVGRGVTEANWPAECFLMEHLGEITTPAAAITATRTVVKGDNPAAVLRALGLTF
jgi:hypothetical protein